MIKLIKDHIGYLTKESQRYIPRKFNKEINSEKSITTKHKSDEENLKLQQKQVMEENSPNARDFAEKKNLSKKQERSIMNEFQN